ncbi:MAG: type III pantothenate kinase [Rhodocyclaceae bacterium]|nr:type III pantothenate kinase [Rhodocyclaceae bacterium]MDP2195079.1 type III pantothenate kinase [Rhodocyclaceae bacterium]
MILCLDAGNTRLKWGLWDGHAWLGSGALAHAESGQLIDALPVKPSRVLACNVAGELVAARIEALAASLSVPLDWFRSSLAAGGVSNGYDTPAQLGADRWAALLGAHSLHDGAALVVMAGTATTIDTLDANGVFRGGLILPGLELMRQALARNTAGLPVARGVFRELPTNTDDAIVSGCIAATLGAIERMARHLHGDDLLCLISGGTAVALAPHLQLPLRHVDNLVLTGLARASTFDRERI